MDLRELYGPNFVSGVSRSSSLSLWIGVSRCMKMTLRRLRIRSKSFLGQCTADERY